MRFAHSCTGYMRTKIKFYCIVFILLFFVLVSTLRRWLFRDKKKNQAFYIRWQQICSSWINHLAGLQIHVKDFEKVRQGGKNFLIVSNHQTYLDVLIIGSLLPSAFAANSDLKKKPALGAITRSGGAVFVERKGKEQLVKDIKKIADLLKEGISVVLFPEGTTSDGVSLLPFKAPFLKSAVMADADILPVCIKYEKIDHKKILPEDRKKIVYQGSTNFKDHLFNIIKMGQISVKVTFLDRIPVKPGITRKWISEKAYQAIDKEFSAD